MDVNQGNLSVSAAASILGISRQGLWKLRRKVNEYGMDSVCGKRDPKTYHRAHNRKPK